METITNAMDISLPNNFPRVLVLAEQHGLPLDSLLSSMALTDGETRQAMQDLYRGGYLADPHSALAWAALNRSLTADEQGVFLCTAHPAKFLEVIEDTLGIEVELPVELAAVRDKSVLSTTIPGHFEDLRRELLALG